MHKLMFAISILSVLACKPEPQKSLSLVNKDHLFYLSDRFERSGDSMAGVWIYCEAPDYHFVTDEDEGYTCVDDVARALVFLARDFKNNPSKESKDLLSKYAAFILSMQAENGYFYNFTFPDKSINKDHINSEAKANWWSWRAFWAFSELLSIPDELMPQGLKEKAGTAMQKTLPLILEICPDPSQTEEVEGVIFPSCISRLGTDQLGLIVIGLSNYYPLYPSDEIKSFLEKACKILMGMQLGSENEFPFYASLSWQNYWHAWGNVQAYALLIGGEVLGNQEIIQAGLREVTHFIPYYLKQRPASFRLSKDSLAYQALDLEVFPQIAYNLRPMIFSSLKAFEITQDTSYVNLAVQLGSWLFGDNQAGQRMYDVLTGRTFDGIISTTEVNKNSGAESTIEALLSLQYMEQFPEVLQQIANR